MFRSRKFTVVHRRRHHERRLRSEPVNAEVVAPWQHTKLEQPERDRLESGDAPLLFEPAQLTIISVRWPPVAIRSQDHRTGGRYRCSLGLKNLTSCRPE
jgi:hypothetical protein